MIDKAKSDSQIFVDAFAGYMSSDVHTAKSLLISTFISCHAMMEPEDRYHTLLTLFQIVQEISDERFEDGNDFVDFLKQVVEEQKDSK